MAEDLAGAGQWDEAVAIYRQAVKANPYDRELVARLEEAKQEAAATHYEFGREYLAERQLSEALTELKMAMGYDPSNRDYQAALADALRLKQAQDQLQLARKFQAMGRTDEALAIYERVVELDPSLIEALAGITTLTTQQRAAQSVGQSTKPITMRFQNAKLKEVFEIVARTANINVVFDKDIRDDPITIFLKDMSFDEALTLILNTNGLVSQKVGPDTLLILPNNKQKLAQYQDLMVRTFYLSNAKAKDAVNVVRTLLDSKRIHVDEKVNALIVRDEPAKLALAERMIYAIDREEPEVELDVEVLEVDRTKSLKYGLNFAKIAGAGIVPPGSSAGISTSPTTFTFQQLAALGPSSYLFSFPASVLLDFFKQESDAKTLAAPKVRVLNNRSATVSVGDKQPILLSTTNVLPGQATTGAVPTTSTVTSIEFKDVGVKLTVEPSVTLGDELTLKLKVEVTRLGDQVILQASPEIKQFKFGNRAAETMLALKDDETVVLAGLLQDEQRRNRSRVPWIEHIPLLGDLLTSTTQDTVTTEVIVTITPHIVRKMSVPSVEQQAFWSGTEDSFSTRPRFYKTADTRSRAPLATGSIVPTEARPSVTLPFTSGSGQSVRSDFIEHTPPSETTPKDSTRSSPLQPELALSAEPVQAGVVEGETASVAGLGLRPATIQAATGQEFRVDLTREHLETFTATTAHLGYDLKGLQFLRAVPVMGTVTAAQSPGQVTLTLDRSRPLSGSGVLAMLFFKATARGRFPVVLAPVGDAHVSGRTGKPPTIVVEVP